MAAANVTATEAIINPESEQELLTQDLTLATRARDGYALHQWGQYPLRIPRTLHARKCESADWHAWVSK